VPETPPYSREPGSAAEAAAKAILETCGSAPRLFRNTLAFLAQDKMRLQDLDEAARRFLAWESILAEKEALDLGVEIGEYHGVVRVLRRVFQRLLPERPPPSGASKPTTSSRTFESIAERKLRRRQLTDQRVPVALGASSGR
jgi:hypothetical protein